jgi:putative acetyltransferase
MPEPARAMPEISAERPDQPDVIGLLGARDAYSAALYPPESNHALDLVGLLDPAVLFLVARQDGVAVGCGALVGQADGAGEVKSMWVEPRVRGTGLGRALLVAVETAARDRGVRVLRLETGVRQPEALALYRASGYGEIGPFGAYRPDPLSVFMEKRLRAGAG